MKRMLNAKNVSKLLLLLCAMIWMVGCSSEESSTSPENEGSSELQTAGNEEVTSEDLASGDALVMGLDDTFAPMGFRDESGELVGFDIDLAKEVSAHIGKEIVFQPIDWSMKENELDAGNIDMIWNGYTITPEREQKVAFSTPYLENRQIIVTMSSDILSKADLSGKVVAVQAESSALDAVNNEPEVRDTFQDLVEYSTNVEAFNDLEAGRADAIVVDEVNARYYMNNRGQESYKVLEDNFGTEEYAIGLRKDDTELLTQINEALAEMKDDGTYDSIYGTWFSDN